MANPFNRTPEEIQRDRAQYVTRLHGQIRALLEDTRKPWKHTPEYRQECALLRKAHVMQLLSWRCIIRHMNSQGVSA